ncbi:hypothetical protein [Paenibacillus alkalitolerans]|uniref:hypothetical protein n=1 Tax=Paenibacillus alkalitolerans TaxID=2799335 RepID=UPI0018F7C3F2|nr:hypothetical protein [Paenibacillus alkalitolerans]
MKIHERHGYVIKHSVYGLYLDKSMKQHTASLFGAITFRSEAEANFMLNDSLYYRPDHPEDYKIVPTIEKRMEKGDEDDVQQVG